MLQNFIDCDILVRQQGDIMDLSKVNEQHMIKFIQEELGFFKEEKSFQNKNWLCVMNDKNILIIHCSKGSKNRDLKSVDFVLQITDAGYVQMKIQGSINFDLKDIWEDFYKKNVISEEIVETTL